MHLAGKMNLQQSLVPYSHGFMNLLSKGYHADAAQVYWNTLKAGYLSSL